MFLKLRVFATPKCQRLVNRLGIAPVVDGPETDVCVVTLGGPGGTGVLGGAGGDLSVVVWSGGVARGGLSSLGSILPQPSDHPSLAVWAIWAVWRFGLNLGPAIWSSLAVWAV